VSDVPSDYVDQVKDALEHLQDLVYLRGHPLARGTGRDQATKDIGSARALRQMLLDAIDEVTPPGPLPSGGRQQRIRQLLELRYVEGLPFREVMAELGLSQSQYHRDQRHALEAIATILWDTGAGEAVGGAAGEQPGAISGGFPELDAIASSNEGLVDLNQLLQGVSDLISSIALKRQVSLSPNIPVTGLVIPSNRTILRQLLIGAAEFILFASHGGKLVLSYGMMPPHVCLRVTYIGRVDAAELRTPAAQERLAIGRRSLHLLGGTWHMEQGANELTITMALSDRRRTLLIIDDNHDMVQLVTRFVSDQGYVVLHAGRVQEGLRLAQTARPDAILLDVMLPEQDGWDALQALHHHPDTKAIPVVVCTVLGEADLALSLGAADFLRKPVTRPVFLETLRRCVDRMRPPEGGGPARSEPSEAVRSPETSRR